MLWPYFFGSTYSRVARLGHGHQQLHFFSTYLAIMNIIHNRTNLLFSAPSEFPACISFVSFNHHTRKILLNKVSQLQLSIAF